MIAIINYGLGNAASIRNMLKKIGVESTVTAEPEAIRAADKLILPGVGAFDEGMKRLDALGIRPLLDELVLERHVPVLGICLGMQLLGRSSEEGNRPGLAWIAADTRKFRFQNGHSDLRIPHMGWNRVTSCNNCSLFEGYSERPRFYFVHSYHVVCDRPQDVAGTTDYGREFTSAVAAGNIAGTQFHPEKSHKYGIQLLRNFTGSCVPC